MHPWVVTDTETGGIIATFDLDVDAYNFIKPGMSLYQMGDLVLMRAVSYE